MNTQKISVIILTAVLIYGCSGKADQFRPQQNTTFTPEPISQELIKEHAVPSGKAFTDYLEKHKDGPVIPGLYQGAVPQGMAFDPVTDRIYISSYMFNGRPSTISILSAEDGRFIKTVWLYNPDGSPHTGHVGGIAVSRNHVWISSGNGVYRIKKGSVLSARTEEKLQMDAFIPTAVRGSFATYFKGILWIGEFASRDGSYTTPDLHHVKLPSGKINHGWMGGYYIDNETGTIKSKNTYKQMLYPDIIISVPDETQGAAFFEDAIILSLSYGRRNKSRIVSYTNPFKKDMFEYSVSPENGTVIPLAVLEDKTRIRSFYAPPMTEGIINLKDTVAVIFESGSDKYRSTALFPQGRIQLFPAEFLLSGNQ